MERNAVPGIDESRTFHPLRIAVLTVSDTRTEETDSSGRLLAERLETAGHELASYGVRASVVCPSYFRTNLMSSMRGSDEAVGAVVSQLVERSPLTADEIAAAVLAGLERRDEVIVPDQPARDAWALKQNDRAAYDAVMRKQAAKLETMS